MDERRWALPMDEELCLSDTMARFIQLDSYQFSVENFRTTPSSTSIRTILRSKLYKILITITVDAADVNIATLVEVVVHELTRLPAICLAQNLTVISNLN